MKLTVTLVFELHSPQPGAVDAATAALASVANGAPPRFDERIECVFDAHVDGDAPAARACLQKALGDFHVDWCVQPAGNRRKRLLICDMDSTIIGCECIDELADMAGVKPQVAAITDAAMLGELDFEASLRKRVALLEDLPTHMLARTYAERVRLNPGAQALVATMKAGGAHTILVSGGFTYFAERVAADAGFDAFHANALEVDGDRLTGRVIEPILGRDTKRDVLLDACTNLGIEPAEAIAVGDGANDLAMMNAAGLGVAYGFRPVVYENADARVVTRDLASALWFQGYGEGEFRHPMIVTG